MELRTSALINLRVFPSGRALYALQRTREVALALQTSGQDAELAARVGRGVAAAVAVRQLERRWEVQRARGSDGGGAEVLRANNALDGELAAFDRMLAAEANRWKRREPEKAARIEGARQILFPHGVGKVITATHEEELAAVADVLALCDPAGPRRDEAVVRVVTELGLAADLAELERLAADLALAMQRRPAARLSFKAVQAARSDLQEALAEVVVRVLDTTTANGDAARRAELLRAILEQNEAIRAYGVRSQLVPDVDPDTGETTDESPPADPDEA